MYLEKTLLLLQGCFFAVIDNASIFWYDDIEATMENIRRYLYQNKIKTLIVFLLQILMWGMQVIVQFFAIKTFDGAIRLDIQHFLKWISISFAGWLAYYFICMLESYFRAMAVKSMNNDLRKDFYETIYNGDIKNFGGEKRAEYISYITKNVDEISTLAWESVFNLVGRVAQIVWSVAALLYLDFYLFLFAVFSTLIMWFMPKIFEKQIEKIGEDNLKAQAEAMKKFKDLIYGVHILKILSAKNWYLKRGMDASEISEEAKSRKNYMTDILECTMGIVSVLMQILAEVIVVVLAFYGRIGVAVLAGAANLIGGVTNGLSNLTNAKMMIMQSKPYFEILKSTETEKVCDESFNETLTLKNISYSYDDKQILESLNMEFKKNGKYAIVGKSGRGKSTILKIIMGIIKDYEGEVLYDGRVREKALDTSMSYISQDVYLFNASIKENIVLGGEFLGTDISNALFKSSLQTDIENFRDGIDTIVGENGANISGGEKQRIAIARSLINGKDTILIDEGTSALDRENRAAIEENLLKSENLTIIMVSHNLDENTRKLFDEIYEI